MFYTFMFSIPVVTKSPKGQFPCLCLLWRLLFGASLKSKVNSGKQTFDIHISKQLNKENFVVPVWAPHPPNWLLSHLKVFYVVFFIALTIWWCFYWTCLTHLELILSSWKFLSFLFTYRIMLSYLLFVLYIVGKGIK